MKQTLPITMHTSAAVLRIDCVFEVINSDV